jgi:hypothetical protein
MLAGGVAYASIPDGNGVVHGCYKPGLNGALSVVDTGAGQSCPAGSTSLNWYQSMPQYATVLPPAVDVPAGTEFNDIALCPAGSILVSGGYYANNGGMEIQSSYPAINSRWPTGAWQVTGFNQTDSDQAVFLEAVCAQTNP